MSSFTGSVHFPERCFFVMLSLLEEKPRYNSEENCYTKKCTHCQRITFLRSLSMNMTFMRICSWYSVIMVMYFFGTVICRRSSLLEDRCIQMFHPAGCLILSRFFRMGSGFLIRLVVEIFPGVIRGNGCLFGLYGSFFIKKTVQLATVLAATSRTGIDKVILGFSAVPCMGLGLDIVAQVADSGVFTLFCIHPGAVLMITGWGDSC